MFLRFLRLLIVLVPLTSGSVTTAESPLRICADPDNLPFSNRSGGGFDQRVAALVAHDLHRTPIFVWVRSRRGFLREQFNKGACDVLLGVPSLMRSVSTTIPYYKSSYVFVSPTVRHLHLTSFADPALNGQRIGLQILEEDLSPPSLPLIREGHAGQLVGFDSFGKQEGDVVRAVADGRVGVAVVWGPVAGFFAQQSKTPLTISPIASNYRFAGVPFTYAISLGVHKRDMALLSQLNASIERMRPQIERTLAGYHLPTTSEQEGQ
ncbi:MAG: extracellular solute-binding protein [Edaphobacter sp.]|nr:extracellular solute-binding protein [Edaphobacter sp.]